MAHLAPRLGSSGASFDWRRHRRLAPAQAVAPREAVEHVPPPSIALAPGEDVYPEYLEEARREIPMPRRRPGLAPGAYSVGEETYAPKPWQKLLGAAASGWMAGARGPEAGQETYDRIFEQPYATAMGDFSNQEEMRQSKLRSLAPALEVSEAREQRRALAPGRDAQTLLNQRRAQKELEPSEATLSPGQKRFRGGEVIAEIPESPGSGYAADTAFLFDQEGRPYVARHSRSGETSLAPVEVPEGVRLTPAGGAIGPRQEASFDIQRERLELQRQAAEDRRARGTTGQLTQAQKAQRLQNLRSLILRMRSHPILGRQVRDMTDQELMEQEAMLIYGVGLDELRTAPDNQQETLAAEEQALPPGWIR